MKTTELKPAAHTATPWRILTHRSPSYKGLPESLSISGDGVTSLAGIYSDGVGDEQANAALIVAAVNSHASLTAERDQLRAALETLANNAEAILKRGYALEYGDSSSLEMAEAEARAALALASTEGGQ